MKKQFDLLLDIAKASKTQYLICYDNNAYSKSNDVYANLRIFDVNPLGFLSKWLVAVETAKLIDFAKNIQKDSLISMVLNFPHIIISADDTFIQLDVFNVSIDAFVKIPVALLYPPYHTIVDLKQNQSFQQYMDMKADDGALITNLDGNLVSMYSGMLNDTKADNISAEFRKYDNVSILVSFTVYKKNKFNTTTVIRYRSL